MPAFSGDGVRRGVGSFPIIKERPRGVFVSLIPASPTSSKTYLISSISSRRRRGDVEEKKKQREQIQQIPLKLLTQLPLPKRGDFNGKVARKI